jgi:hypothetical protein
MEIANIVSETKINVGPEFNVVSSVDEIIFKNLPTLIIGYNTICDLYGVEKINVLKRNVTDKIFWTFKRNVKRNLYESDLEDFIRFSYNIYIDKISYVDLDVIQFSPQKLLKITRKILNLTNAISYKSEIGVIYIYSENIIFGVDLNTLKYVGLDIEKIENKIKEKSVVFLTGKEILIEYSNHLGRLENDLKYLPFLYSINPYD